MEINAVNLVKSYRKTPVVNGISLNVQTGEVVGLLGPNGAGKTTTFYMIVGLVKPQAGKVMIDNEEMYGSEFNLASKLGEDLAQRGEILLTEAAFQQLEEKVAEYKKVEFSISGLELVAYKVQ